MRTLRNILVSLLLLTFSGCAGAPPNIPVCVELSPERGFCVRVMSGETFEVNESAKLEGKTWWDGKPSMVIVPATSWRDLKIWINKICKNNSQCDSAVANWQRTVNTIDAATQ